MFRILILSLLSLLVTACSQNKESLEPDRAGVNLVLDNWHQAASKGDLEAYFSAFANDSSIFMGTDATERWTVAEFQPWAEPYFADGMAWDFTPVFRKVYFSDSGQTAWFDEELDTPNLGPSRGSGVLVRTEEGWKITHYNLSIPIPNSIVDTVVTQINNELNRSE